MGGFFGDAIKGITGGQVDLDRSDIGKAWNEVWVPAVQGITGEANKNPPQGSGPINPSSPMPMPPGKGPAKTPNELVPGLIPTQPNDQTSIKDMSAEEMRRQRGIDYNIGMQRGSELFKEGSLGRMNLDASPMLQAQRQLAQANINRTMQTQQRALAAAQARARMPAGANFAQRAALTRQQQQAQNEAARQQNIDAYGQQKEQTMFNLGQGNKELFGKLATALSEQGFGVTERTGAMQSEIAKAMAAAAANSKSGGKK